MNRGRAIPLLFIGRDSLFPFSGMFFVNHQSEAGWCHVVGRFNETDLKQDFAEIREFERGLRSTVEDVEADPPKERLQHLWDFVGSEELFAPANSTMVCLLGVGQEVFLFGTGVSGLWGNTENTPRTWYQMLPDSHSFFKGQSDKPHCLMLSGAPWQVLVRAKPSSGSLPTEGALVQRIFEVAQ